jgi:D-alanine-D-alanine ligase
VIMVKLMQHKHTGLKPDLLQKYGKVAVIMGGFSTEREVSLISGNAVLESLLRSGVDAHKFDPAETPYLELATANYACAVIMLHGKHGEDGTIQGLLECLQIPYTGSGVLSSAVAMDKYRTKLIWAELGIPLPKHVYLSQNNFDYTKFKLQLGELEQNLGLPVVVKPACGGSTLGLTKVYQIEELEEAIELAFQYDEHILIEQMIIGDEYTITLCGDRVYPVVKIEAVHGDYDYNSKYFTDDTRYICPYDLGDLSLVVEKYARLGYQAINASGVARLDFMVERQSGRVYFLEINTIPGMTAHSLSPRAFKAVGIGFDELCLHILDGAHLESHLEHCISKGN